MLVIQITPGGCKAIECPECANIETYYRYPTITCKMCLYRILQSDDIVESVKERVNHYNSWTPPVEECYSYA